MPDLAGSLPASPQPWRPEQQIAVLVGLTLSALLIFAGWIGTSLRPDLLTQYPWFTLGALGVTLSGAVQARWLLAGFIELRRRQREVFVPALEVRRANPGTLVESAPSTTFVVVSGGKLRYHRPCCAIAAGKPTEPHTPTDRDGRLPCGLCTQQPPKS